MASPSPFLWAFEREEGFKYTKYVDYMNVAPAGHVDGGEVDSGGVGGLSEAKGFRKARDSILGDDSDTLGLVQCLGC